WCAGDGWRGSRSNTRCPPCKGRSPRPSTILGWVSREQLQDQLRGPADDGALAHHGDGAFQEAWVLGENLGPRGDVAFVVGAEAQLFGDVFTKTNGAGGGGGELLEQGCEVG